LRDFNCMPSFASPELLSYYEACEPRHEFEVPGIEVPTRLDGTGQVIAPKTPGLGLMLDWPGLESSIDWVSA